MMNAIPITTTDRRSEALREILAGIEEEGVGWEICEIAGDDGLHPEALAYSNANNCTFGCGIGLSGNKSALCILSSPPIYLNADSPDSYRRLGKNAAAYVKKERFVLE